jgi:hypothetical protein
MIGLLWIATAHADPVALRAPVASPALTAGSHDISVGGPLSNNRWVAAELGTDLGTLGASAGTRWALGPDDRPRVLQGGLAAGLLLPTVEPGLALTGTPWIHGGWVGRAGALVAGAAMPLAVGTGGVRLPLLFELQGGVRVGPIYVQGRVSAGPVYSALDTSLFLEPALIVQLDR